MTHAHWSYFTFQSNRLKKISTENVCSHLPQVLSGHADSLGLNRPDYEISLNKTMTPFTPCIKTRLVSRLYLIRFNLITGYLSLQPSEQFCEAVLELNATIGTLTCSQHAYTLMFIRHNVCVHHLSLAY